MIYASRFGYPFNAILNRVISYKGSKTVKVVKEQNLICLDILLIYIALAMYMAQKPRLGSLPYEAYSLYF